MSRHGWDRPMGRSPAAQIAIVRRKKLFDAASGKCFYCGHPVDNPGCEHKRDWIMVGYGARMVREHKMPVIRGGQDAADNYACSCAGCNGEKGAFTVSEFRLWRGFQTKTLDFRFAGEPPAARQRDWIVCHSPEFQRRLMLHNMPSAAEAFALSNAWARGLRAQAKHA